MTLLNRNVFVGNLVAGTFVGSLVAGSWSVALSPNLGRQTCCRILVGSLVADLVVRLVYM